MIRIVVVDLVVVTRIQFMCVCTVYIAGRDELFWKHISFPKYGDTWYNIRGPGYKRAQLVARRVSPKSTAPGFLSIQGHSSTS
jgi:hypothetical protein